MKSARRLCRVAVPGPFIHSFTYFVPDTIEAVEPGQRVIVPFGRTSHIGYFLGWTDEPIEQTVKPIAKLHDLAPLISPELVKLCLWISEYYVANPADCLALALPTAARKKQPFKLVWSASSESTPLAIRALMQPGKTVKAEELNFLKARHRLTPAQLVARCIAKEVWPDTGPSGRTMIAKYRLAEHALERWDEFHLRRKVKPSPFEGQLSRSELIELGWTPHQISSSVKAGLLDALIRDDARRSFEAIPPRLEVQSHRLTDEQRGVVQLFSDMIGKGFAPCLLHGITGSGKSLVYCHTAERVTSIGKTVLVLTPEIALAGTMLGYLRGYFGDQIAIIHSAMGDRARLQTWEAIRNGKYKIVVGPRSALFAPLSNLGLIIVDEEHDGSYKQDDPSPRFHGRDAAVMRARIANIPVILGSASPSVESYHQAKRGKYQLLEIKDRPAGACLPAVRIIDLREDRLGGDLGFMSYSLKKEIESRLSRGEQVILFLNRRGYASMLKCGKCGHSPNCPVCDIHMTYHKAGGGRLECHYCGAVRRNYSVCEKCGGHGFVYLGAGTQRLEESIERLFPVGKPLRFDSDAASGEFGAHAMLSEFGQGKYNLLLGTQMVTKGLDFPNVSLVGVLSADHGMDLPDFRASEKTFARLLQVAGRAGRNDKAGEVIIQTYDPLNPVIGFAAKQDYAGFFEGEIAKRHEHEFPPFTRLANFEFSGRHEEQVTRELAEFKGRLEAHLGKSEVSFELLGPAPCPHSYVKGQFRRHLLLKTTQMTSVSRMLGEWERAESRFGVAPAVKVRIDIDPIDLM